MVSEKIKQEVEVLSMEENIKNLEREKDNFEKNIEFHENLLGRLKRDKEAMLKKYDIMKDNFKILKPVWAYEEIPEYMDCLSVELESKREHDINLFDKNEEQISKTLVHQRASLESVQNELNRLKGEDDAEEEKE